MCCGQGFKREEDCAVITRSARRLGGACFITCNRRGSSIGAAVVGRQSTAGRRRMIPCMSPAEQRRENCYDVTPRRRRRPRREIRCPAGFCLATMAQRSGEPRAGAVRDTHGELTSQSHDTIAILWV